MPSPGKHLIVCLFVLSGVHLLHSRNPPSYPSSPLSPAVSAGPATAVAPVKRSQDFNLRERSPISKRLPRGALHVYRVLLEKNTFLHAWVDQDSVKGQEIDIALHLYGPQGPLFEIDSPTDEFGSEEIFLLADRPGTYRVEVEGFGEVGVYRIRVDTVRPATAADRINAQAAQQFFHARKISRENPPQVDQAVQEYLEAEFLWRGVGNKRWQAHALDRAARILAEHQPRDWKRVLALQTRALNLFSAEGDRRWTAKTLVETGVAQKQLGELAQAESPTVRPWRLRKMVAIP